MAIPWHDIVKTGDEVSAINATLEEKASIIGRVGIMMLSCGTGAWRVRDSMNIISRALGVSTVADIGLLTIEYTCTLGNEVHTRLVSLANTAVNTEKLMNMERFITMFDETCKEFSVDQHHRILDHIKERPGLYKAVNVGLAAGIACCGFTFLLGGGPVEMACAFVGAGLGNFTRRKLTEKKLTLLVSLMLSVAAACLTYILTLFALGLVFDTELKSQAGYICSMLFVIPGFPLITGGIDLAKLDMRSGIERIAYALLIIITSTITGGLMAGILDLTPGEFGIEEPAHGILIALRLLAGFAGVYGFSIMFNSRREMAAIAGVVGTIANTIRLELIDSCGVHAAFAAFIGALLAGLMATFVKHRTGFPRISLTVPSIVIMVPGLFLYRSIYYMGQNSVVAGMLWLNRALLIIVALPLGLIVARTLTDKNFRNCS